MPGRDELQEVVSKATLLQLKFPPLMKALLVKAEWKLCHFLIAFVFQPP